MNNKKRIIKKRCKQCHNIVDRIWFAVPMTEEWSWNGWNWECTARHSLTTDPQQSVLCPHCETVVGTGLDFGFGKGFKN